MFFLLNTGKVSKEGKNNCIHVDDDFIHFDSGKAFISFSLDKNERKTLSYILREGFSMKTYLDNGGMKQSHLIALEDDDEGYRNLVISNDGINFSVNLKSKFLEKFADFLDSYKL